MQSLFSSTTTLYALWVANNAFHRALLFVFLKRNLENRPTRPELIECIKLTFTTAIRYVYGYEANGRFGCQCLTQ